MSPAVYDRLAALAQQAEITAKIREGMAEAAAGKSQPAKAAVREIADGLGIALDP